MMTFQIIENPKHYFFVTEVAPKGELSAYIKSKTRLPAEECLKYFRQLISALRYMHSKNISHRDIKPPNILLDENLNLKLIDFGLGSFYNQNEKLKTPCGSPCYAAPELINGEEYNPELADVWSCGITLYVMAYGVLPFDEPTKEELYDKILACKYTLPAGPHPGILKLIKKIFVLSPKRRITLEGITKDQWFCDNLPANIVSNPFDSAMPAAEAIGI
jgi:5'-AMP-activated protein kinase, catalytic alpha subunit